MIKINLLPIKKKKKKSKPIPGFLIGGICGLIATILIMGYLFYFFSSRLSDRKKTVAANEKTLAELAEKIKAVEDFEKKNADFKKQKELIEQLSKDRLTPAKVMDEISAQLPVGVWLNTLSFTGDTVTMGCTGFNNTDVVNYVTNLKNSKIFTDVNLQESVQASVGGFSVYNFRLTFKVKV
jgi:type IV pilus assembly protein PilN